jgi:hypothetical protein
MSMDEMLMNELYGSEEVQQEEQIKQAQVELVEAVAAEAGVDLNELDDEELAKFAHYVLSDEDEIIDSDATEYDEETAKLAALQEADLMGRQMAHSYIDELNQIQHGENNMDNNTFSKVASAMGDVAEAWAMEQESGIEYETEKTASIADMIAHELEDQEKLAFAGTIGGALEGRKQRKMSREQGVNDEISRRAGSGGLRGAGRGYLRDIGYTAAGAGVGTGLGSLIGPKSALAGSLIGGGLGQYASYKRSRARQKDKGELARMKHKALVQQGKGYKQEKKASLFLDAGYDALAAVELCTPEEFAKEAEFRAAEILAANGVHPETFEDIQPEEIKIASFPGVEHASDEYEAAALEEYNDMLDTAAMHIIENLLED